MNKINELLSTYELNKIKIENAKNDIEKTSQLVIKFSFVPNISKTVNKYVKKRKADISVYRNTNLKIEALINSIKKENYRMVLKLRYIEGLKGYEIAEKMLYETDSIYKLQAKAIKHLQKLAVNDF